jgi:DNA polymerase III sliding clamp (beta) subunit (PCNA family)
MKLNTEAFTLAAALDIANSLPTGKSQTLAHLTADNGALSITCTNGSVSIEAAIPVNVVEAGEVTVPADRITALIGSFTTDTAVWIAVKSGAVHVIGGGGNYQLPIATAPIPLMITGTVSTPIEITGKDALRLFEVVEAAEDEKVRPYLAGVHLDTDHDGWLTSVATNGALLILATAKTAVKITGTTIPTSGVEIATKLIKATKAVKVSLRRSDRLLEITGEAFRFTTRLIETKYPDWRRVLPSSSENMAVIARNDLVDALTRLAAIVDPASKVPPLVVLTWSEGSKVEVSLLRAGIGSSRIITKEMHGEVKVALSLKSLLTLADQFNMKDIMLEAAPDIGVMIHDNRLEHEPSGFRLSDAKFGMLSFTRWNFEEQEAAA